MMNTTNSNGFHNITNVVAVTDATESTGCIVWWRLSGTVDYETMKAAWLEAGLDEEDLPSSCTPTVALRRAAGELRERRRLIRPLGKGNGFALVKERDVDQEEELEYDVLAKIGLDEVGRVHVSAMKNCALDFATRITNEVRQAYDRHLETLETEDFSHWLVRMMPKLDAVSLRDKGGVYFIPAHAVENVRKVVEVLRKVSGHVVNRVPAMRSDDAVSAILDAVVQEAEAEAASMEQDVEKMSLGERGFENRISTCDAVEAKVARYEELLGATLPKLHERLEALRANLSVAVLKAQSTKEGEGSSLSLL